MGDKEERTSPSPLGACNTIQTTLRETPLSLPFSSVISSMRPSTVDPGDLQYLTILMNAGSKYDSYGKGNFWLMTLQGSNHSQTCSLYSGCTHSDGGTHLNGVRVTVKRNVLLCYCVASISAVCFPIGAPFHFNLNLLRVEQILVDKVLFRSLRFPHNTLTYGCENIV